MSLSSVKSETTLRSRLFSSSRSFRRSPARSSAHRTPGATDNTSPRSPRSGGLRPPCSGPARPEHRPAATSRRSLQACIASLSLQSSLMSKTYLKSDHFNGGGSGATVDRLKRSVTITDPAVTAAESSTGPSTTKIAVHTAPDGGARYEQQPTRLKMKKLFLTGVAALAIA